MRRFCHHTLVVVAATVVFSCTALSNRSAVAQGNWQYVPELAGGQPAWLDWDTGLVWGDYDAIAQQYGSWSWNGTKNIFLPLYRADTGVSGWRMATVAELKTISAHGGYLHMLPDLYWDGTPAAIPWALETKGKKFAYTVNLVTGAANWYDNSGIGKALPVYRLFTP